MESVTSIRQVVPRLSIITVNYNNAGGLARTLKSVSVQTFRDFEYIIIDGGSTDGSVDLIKQFGPIVDYWVSEKDKGVYDAMNKGIERAKGTYCYFLNSGDYLWKDNVLEKVFEIQNGEDILYGNMIHGGLDTEEKGASSISFYDFYTGSIYHQAAFIRRELFTQVGLYNENLKVVADWEFFLKAIFIHKCRIRYVDLPIALYETGGLSFRDPEGNLRDRKMVLEQYFPRFIADYNELRKLRESDFIGLLWLMENNKPINRVLRVIMRLSRFIRFNVLKKTRGPRKTF